MSWSRGAFAGALAVAGTCGVSHAGDVTYEFISLTGLEGESFRVAELNNVAQVAGTIIPDGLFRWDDGELLTVELTGVAIEARGMNENGTIVGTRRNPDTLLFEIVIWNPDNGQLDFIAPATELDPFAINDDLHVVGITFDQLVGFALDVPLEDVSLIAFGGMLLTAQDTLDHN